MPVRLNRRRYGGGGPSSSGRPELSSSDGSNLLPPCGSAASGLSRSDGWPLNQKGTLAASLTPETGVVGSGAISPGGGPPVGTNVTVWNPLILQRTLSPLWIVTVRRKYALVSPNAAWNCFACGPNGPVYTVLVTACAAAGAASAMTVTSAPAIRPCIGPSLVGYRFGRA